MSSAASKIDVGDGTWTLDLTGRFVERVLGLLSRHVPNVLGTVVGHRVTTPDTLSQYNSNAGPGDPYGGAQDLAQSFFFRPLPGQPSHRTFVPNLYTLGAGTWPGAGVSGGPGYIVAQQLLGGGYQRDRPHVKHVGGPSLRPPACAGTEAY